MKADEDSSGWGRKLAISVFATPLAKPGSNDGWVRKNSPEETNSSPSEPREGLDALRESQYPTGIVLTYHDRHWEEKPRWYLEISRDPHQVNSCNEAIGLGSFYNCQPYDYTNDELNLPQGHEDCIRTANLLPADRKQHADEDDDSVLPTDWLECTAEAHPSLDWSFGPGIWKRLMIGDLMTQYDCFYTGATREFSDVHNQKHCEHILRL
jgi:hypothetical protein